MRREVQNTPFVLSLSDYVWTCVRRPVAIELGILDRKVMHVSSVDVDRFVHIYIKRSADHTRDCYRPFIGSQGIRLNRVLLWVDTPPHFENDRPLP